MSVHALGAILFFAGSSAGVDAPGAVLPASVRAMPMTIFDSRGAALPMPSAPSKTEVGASAEVPATSPAQLASAAETGHTHVTEPGEIVVTSRARSVPGDPLQELNFATFQVTQAVDDAVVRPAAMAYSRIVPEPIRLGVRNFLDNLQQPVVFANFVLQHKIGKAAETFVRFGINSTIGVLGLFDFAKRKPFRLPNRKNGFAYTMGFYGIKSGPFLFLPVVGPTTARDLVGLVIDRLLLPVAIGRAFRKPQVALPLAVLGQLDQRDQFDEKIEALKGDTSGFYTATREEYLKDRQAYIDELRGTQKTRAVPAMPLPPPVPR